MSADSSTTFRGNAHRSPAALQAWLDTGAAEPAIDPDLPIIDAHHHLWDDHRGRYLIHEFAQDAACGHRIVASVYAQCMAMFRAHGPEMTRPVGEVEFVTGMAAMSESGGYGATRVALGIIGYADLTAGDGAAPVLDALLAAGGGRLKGIRVPTQWDASGISRHAHPAFPAGTLRSAGFRNGFAHVVERGLVFDAWVYHPQLADVMDLADRFPRATIVVDHLGGPLGVGPYGDRREEVLTAWRGSITELARRENVHMKLGGAGMPVFGFDAHLAARPPGSATLAATWRPYIEHCIEAFGHGRAMFETNFPPDRQSCSYGTLWNAFKRIAAGCSQTERTALFSGTAARVYGLAGLVEQEAA